MTRPNTGTLIQMLAPAAADEQVANAVCGSKAHKN